MRKFKEMKIGEDVSFFAVVEALQKRYTPNKSAYYSISLSDGESTTDARVWDTALIEGNNVTIGKVYHFTAHINEYASKKQFVINAVREVLEGEVDMKQFIKSAPLTEENLRTGIKEYIKKIENEILRKLVIHIINTISKEYFTYPGAMSMHHNYASGLAYHTYSMLRLAEKLLEIYPGMNSDLLYSGVLLHDIGKVRELSGINAPTYTVEGNLLGHIVMGIQMISVAAAELKVEESEEVLTLLHLISSHHGELEFGSPKEPAMMEAYALHLVDLTDSKLAAISPAVSRSEKGQLTEPINSLGRKGLYVPKL